MSKKRPLVAPSEPFEKRSRLAVLRDLIEQDGGRLSDIWDPWQEEDFMAILDAAPYPNAFLERPRGHSKTSDMGSLACVELLAGADNQKLFAVAADQQQADLLRDDVEQKMVRGGFVASGHVKVTKNRITSVPTGSVLEVLPADAPSAYGLRPDWICFDEIEEQKNRKLWDALFTATGKRPKCRMLVIGTAGYLKTSLAWEIRELAQREANWYFKSRPQCASWISKEWLASQKRSLPPHVYARLHDNRWVDAVGAWLTFEQVNFCFQHGVPLGDEGPRVLSLDVGITRDKSVAAIVRLTPEGLFCVEHLETWTPPEGGKQDLIAIQQEVVRLARERKVRAVVVDPYQTILMAQQLVVEFKKTNDRIEVVADPITATTRDGMFGFLRDTVVDQHLRSIQYPDFRDELLGMAFEKTTSGRYRVDHQNQANDDHVFAVGLGCHYLGREVKPMSHPTFWAQGEAIRRDAKRTDPRDLDEQIHMESGVPVVFRRQPGGMWNRDHIATSADLDRLWPKE